MLDYMHYICSVVDNASELHAGSMNSIPTLGFNFHYFLTTPHGEEFAQLKPCLGILVYESKEERIIQTGNCNLIENLYISTKSQTRRRLNINSPS